MEQLYSVFSTAGFPLYEVGGYVRDSLQGLTPNDIDYATRARPDEIKRILSSADFKVIPIGEEFGTIQTIIGEDKIEITTFRCAESYTKGSRKPSVQWGDTIEQDLARRDFTINAIARLAGTDEIVDPYGGLSDFISRQEQP